jgi:hypothetical protein
MRPGRACSEAASNGAHARPAGHIYSRPEVRNLCTGSVAITGSDLRWKIQRATANPTATYIRLRAFITPPFQRPPRGEVVRCPEVSKRTKVQQQFERASAWLKRGVTVPLPKDKGHLQAKMMEPRAFRTCGRKVVKACHKWCFGRVSSGAERSSETNPYSSARTISSNVSRRRITFTRAPSAKTSAGRGRVL